MIHDLPAVQVPVRPPQRQALLGAASYQGTPTCPSMVHPHMVGVQAVMGQVEPAMGLEPPPWGPPGLGHPAQGQQQQGQGRRRGGRRRRLGVSHMQRQHHPHLRDGQRAGGCMARVAGYVLHVLCVRSLREFFWLGMICSHEPADSSSGLSGTEMVSAEALAAGAGFEAGMSTFVPWGH